MIGYRITAVILGYIFGLFQTGYIYGKIKHLDIRDFGSGNAGTTNAMRVLGKKAGIITYMGDTFKAIFAGIAIRLVCYYIFDIHDDSFVFLLLLYTGLGVVLGHNFPFYMGFKGGKGIAASSGVILALADIKLILLAFCTFVIITVISKYVSLGSICMMTGFFIEVVIFGSLGIIPTEGYLAEFIILSFIFSGLAIFRHRANIARLVNGTERRIGQGRTGQSKTGQGKTGQSETGQSKTGQGKTGQGKTDQEKEEAAKD